MTAGDPYPTGDKVTIKVPAQFAADFLTGQLGSAMSERPALRMVLRETEGGPEVDLGAWQVELVASRHHSADYDDAVAQLRAVFD